MFWGLPFNGHPDLAIEFIPDSWISGWVEAMLFTNVHAQYSTYEEPAGMPFSFVVEMDAWLHACVV
jgi:hypothetical protein